VGLQACQGSFTLGALRFKEFKTDGWLFLEAGPFLRTMTCVIGFIISLPRRVASLLLALSWIILDR
jgi:hypothetical protein